MENGSTLPRIIPNPEDGSVSLSGPVDSLAQSSIDAVDGVAAKPGEFGRFQGGQISGKLLNNLPKPAFCNVDPFE